MKFEKSKLETIKNALQYAVISAKTESETAEFGLLLLEVLPLVGLKRTTFQAMLNNQNPNKTNFKYYD